MTHMASEGGTSKSKGSSIKKVHVRLMRINSVDLRYVVCVKTGDSVDLDLLKVYKVRKDRAAMLQGLLRVIDESGEDYLYPAAYFKPIQAPSRLFQIVKKSA